MKILYCSRCGDKVGEIDKGKFKHTAVCLCGKCNDRIKIAEGRMDINKSTKGSNNMSDMMDDLFGGRDIFGNK